MFTRRWMLPAWSANHLSMDYPKIPWESLEHRPVQPHPRIRAPPGGTLQSPLGDLSHYPHRVRPRLPVRVRILHCYGVLRRHHPVPQQRERRGRDAASEGAFQTDRRADCGVLRRRQLRHQFEAHKVVAAGHYRGRRAALLGGTGECEPVAR